MSLRGFSVGIYLVYGHVMTSLFDNGVGSDFIMRDPFEAYALVLSRNLSLQSHDLGQTPYYHH